jgi:hypothetical protein
VKTLVLAFALALATVPLAAAKVAPGEAMTAPRAAHTATLLASGEVLVTGGCTLDGCETDARSASTEMYDPGRGTFHAGPRLDRPRIGHIATAVGNDVLVAGGWPGEGSVPTDTAELYDSEQQAFVQVGEMTSRRGGLTATRLRDGRVLLVGGTDGNRALATAELYDPKARRFAPTGRMRTAREAHAAVLLRDGRVLVVGGRGVSGRVLASAELYDPRTGRFTPAGRLRAARQKHAAVTLRDGSVLVVGGASADDFSSRHATAEVFDPARGRTRRLVRMREQRYKLTDAVVRLPSGRVLVAAGGVDAELYDPRSGRFRVAGRIGTRLSFSTATLLRDGRVLVAGGYDDRIAVTGRTWTYRG